MGLLTGIGDFFRGAFGEDENEKKRRKQREAQQAQQRKQQPAPQIQRQQVQTVNDMFGKKPQTPVAPAAKPQQLQQTKKPPVAAPKIAKPLATPPTKVDFTKLNATPAVPNRKFAKGKAPDAGSAQDIKNKFIDTLAASTARVSTGLVQAAAGNYDILTPGKGTNRVSKATTKQAEEIDRFATKQGIETGYKAANVGLEVGSYIIPSTAATKIASAFPRGVKITDAVIDKAAKLVDDAGEAGKVRKFLADRMRKGYGLDEAIEDSAISARYVGQNAAKGNDTTPQSVATDVALGLGGGLVFPGRAVKSFTKGNAADEAAGASTASIVEGGRLIDNTKAGEASQAAQKEIEQKGIEKAAEKDLEELANDSAGTALDRKKARDELNRRKAAAEQADPATRPAYQVKQDADNIVKQEEENLSNFLQANPGLTKAQREAAVQAAKDRSDKLVAELKATREAAVRAVDDQGQANTQTVQAGQTAVDTAQTASKAKTAPAPEDIVQATPTPANAEATANNAYTPQANTFSGIKPGQDAEELLDDIITRSGIDITRKERKNLFSQVFGIVPKTTQKATNPLSDIFNKVATKGINSKNGITSTVAQLPRGIWSRFGMGDKARATIDSVNGLRNTSRQVGLVVARRRNETIKKLIDDGADPADITKKLQQVFETPEFLARKYGDGTPKLTPDQLPPELKLIVDEQIDLNKVRNYINFKTGVIDEATYFQGTDGMHTPRVYGFDFAKQNADAGVFNSQFNNFDTTAGISRNELKDVPDNIFDTVIDPLTAQDIRFQQSLVNKSRMDAIEKIKTEFGAFDKAPNRGFVKLEGKQFGSLDGKYVDNQVATTLKGSPVFKTQLGEKTNDILDIYRTSPLGSLDRFFKQTKTVGSVGTHVGNIGSNVTLFSGGAGISPTTALTRGIGGARSLVAEARGGVNPDLYFLRKKGIIGEDVGRALNGIAKKDVIKVESLLTEAENLAKTNPRLAIKAFDKAWGLLQDVYGGTDDAFKVGAFRSLKARGYSDDAALRLVREQFQNYDNVGRGMQMFADSPVLGKPFARFIPELARITKNSVKNNPVGMGAGVAGLAYLSDKASAAAGETPEERTRRETAVGQTLIPGTSAVNKLVPGGKEDGNISLNFALPNDTQVNVARTLGLNFPIAPNTDPNRAAIDQMNPVSLPTRVDKGGHTVFAPEEGVSSMTLNPLARVWANRDFMGRRITDPQNDVRWEGNGTARYKYENPDGTPMDDKKNANYNRLKSLFMAYSPASSEIDAGVAQIKGKEDYYGKERTPGQALARVFGVKAEDNSPETRKKRAEQQQYFEDKLPKVQKFLDENPDLTESYWKLKNTARDRNTEVSQNDLVSPERYRVIAADKSGRLFNFLKEQAIATSKEKKTPLDPLYTLPPDQANQVLKLKSMATGDDMKFQQLLFKEDWYKGYKAADKIYQQNKPAHQNFPGAPKTNERAQEWYDLSEQLNDPDKGIATKFPLVQQYDATIQKNFAGDKYDSDERKAFTKAWYATYGDAYKNQKAAKEAAELEIVNKMRGIENEPPMSAEVWSGQFKTDEDSSYGGYGKGGRGGRGDSVPDVNTLGDLTNFTKGVDRINPIDAQAMPQLAEFFNTLNAGSGGGKSKPKVGASSTGR